LLSWRPVLQLLVAAVPLLLLLLVHAVLPLLFILLLLFVLLLLLLLPYPLDAFAAHHDKHEKITIIEGKVG
jgi:hypothetical protein